MTKFVNDCQKLFDIKGSSEQIKAQENLWKVKMTVSDHEFYNNQFLTAQSGYCSTNIDAKWEKHRKENFDKYLLERSRESNMVRKFWFTFTPYECNP